MRELNINEIEEVNGGLAGVAAALWAIFLLGQEELRELGRDIGRGIYDGEHASEETPNENT